MEKSRAPLGSTSKPKVITGNATAPPPWLVDPATNEPKAIVTDIAIRARAPEAPASGDAWLLVPQAELYVAVTDEDGAVEALKVDPPSTGRLDQLRRRLDVTLDPGELPLGGHQWLELLVAAAHGHEPLPVGADPGIGQLRLAVQVLLGQVVEPLAHVRPTPAPPRRPLPVPPAVRPADR